MVSKIGKFSTLVSLGTFSSTNITSMKDSVTSIKDSKPPENADTSPAKEDDDPVRSARGRENIGEKVNNLFDEHAAMKKLLLAIQKSLEPKNESVKLNTLEKAVFGNDERLKKLETCPKHDKIAKQVADFGDMVKKADEVSESERYEYLN